jgi:hypothetical protein
VLIGKNNAGKSNLLMAIEFSLRHLRRALIAVISSSRRAAEQFTDRDTKKPYRIAVEFDLPESVNADLRERLSKEAPHLDRSIEQIKANNRIVFVIAGASDGRESWSFLEQIMVGSLAGTGEELKTEGIRLIAVPAGVGKELAHTQQQISSLSSDVKRLQALATDRRWQEFVFERKERLRSSFPYNEAVSNLSREALRSLETAVLSQTTTDGVAPAVNQLAAELRDQIDNLKKKETDR